MQDMRVKGGQADGEKKQKKAESHQMNREDER